MTFLENLIYWRLDKFDGLIFKKGGGRWGAYIWNVNSVKYLVGIHLGAILTGFYGILQYVNM